MSDILIVYTTPCHGPDIYINEVPQYYVTKFDVSFNESQDLPILKVNRWKLDRRGEPYTIGGGFVAALTEYYPAHRLEVRWSPMMYDH